LHKLSSPVSRLARDDGLHGRRSDVIIPRREREVIYLADVEGLGYLL
jgi:hypothetical protein